MFQKTLDEEVSSYFEGLGYKYGWDIHGGTAYHEIQMPNGKVVMQFCAHVPLSAFLEDLICVKQDREPTSGYDYILNAAEGDPNFEEILSKL